MTTRPFDWANTDPGVMVTVVRGLSAAEVCDRWGTTAVHPTVMEFHEVVELAVDPDAPQDRLWIAVQQVPGAVVVWELVSLEGLRPEVLGALTGDGVDAIAVWANPKVKGGFAYAVNGVIVAEANSLAPGELRGSASGEIHAVMQQVSLDLHDLWVFDCLALTQALLGVTVEPPDLDEEVLAAQITRRPSVTWVAPSRRRPGAVRVVPVVPGPLPPRGRVQAVPTNPVVRGRGPARGIAQRSPGDAPPSS